MYTTGEEIMEEGARSGLDMLNWRCLQGTKVKMVKEMIYAYNNQRLRRKVKTGGLQPIIIR